MTVFERNIQVFEDTRNRSQTEYASETLNMQSGVSVYTEPENLRVKSRRKAQYVEFDDRSTIAAAFRLSQFKDVEKIGVLNFADALEPGGLVKRGELTQEESLCRCSNLYEGLILTRCIKEYYEYNQSLGHHIYSNRLIYSPNVLVFKHDSTHTLMYNPFFVDMITCPSPSVECDESILITRITGILKAAGANGVTNIVLGAWGCGAFGQDAEVMGKCFGIALKKCNYFKSVCFAIKPTSSTSGDFCNLYEFSRSFDRVYER